MEDRSSDPYLPYDGGGGGGDTIPLQEINKKGTEQLRSNSYNQGGFC